MNPMLPMKHKAGLLLVIALLYPLTFSELLYANTIDQYDRAFTGSKKALFLDDINTRFDISGNKYSTRFFIPPSDASIVDYMTLKDALPVASTATNKPDFMRSNRYWIAIDIVNHTPQEAWQVHVSNFFLHNVTLYYSDGIDEELLISDLSKNPGPISINPIGRSFPLTLRKNTSYTLVLEVYAKITARTPYIGIMAEPHYASWAIQMDYLYKIAIGIILGLVSVSFISCLLFHEKVFFWFGISSLFLLIFNLQLSSMPFELFGWDYEFSLWLWMQASFTIISLLLFAFDFLKVRPESIYLYHSFIFLIAFSILTLCMSFFVSSDANIILYSFNASLMILLMLGAGFHRLLVKGGYYLIYIIGWAPVLFSLLEYIALIFIDGKLSNKIAVSYKAIHELYILIAHILIHSLAIFARIKTLKKQKQLAEMASQAKSWFMAASSHDLRQPLHAMGMHLALLKERVSAPAALRIIDSLENSHAEMNASFKAIMDLSQLEAGVVKVNRRVFFLNDLLNKLYLEFSPLAEEKKLSFRKVGTGVYVESDPLLLERILSNLISNAIRYTVEGKVIVGVRRRGIVAAVQIWDSGCGIAQKELGTIFEIYKRSGNVKRSSEGMGIGLSIVKHLSDLLGHRIKVDSAVGKGTMFELQVPVVQRKIVPIEQESAGNPGLQFTIALVIPDCSIDKAVSGLLTRWGHKVIRYSSVSELHSLPIETLSGINLLVFDASLIKEKADLEWGKRIVYSNRSCILAALVDDCLEGRDERLSLFRDGGIELLYNPGFPPQLSALLSDCRRTHILECDSGLTR